MTFQELKQLKNDIAVKTGLDTAAAARVIGFYNIGGDSEKLQAMINGDMSPVGPALVALGITPENITDITPDNVHTSGSASAGPVVDDLQSITASPDMAPDGVGDDLVGGPDGPKIAQQRKEKPQASKSLHVKEKTITSPQALQNDLVKGPDVVKGVYDDLGPDDLCKADIVEHVQGDILTDGNGLPASIRYDIEENMLEFAQRYNIDLEKCSGLQWRAVCLNVGDMIKASGVLIDRKKQKLQGGRPFKPERVAVLLDLWERFTTIYKHVPLVTDFISFSGVSREWFYDTQEKLSSTQIDIIKKARSIEESALGAALTDSRENPTGRIYYTKARLGWQETTTIQHVTTEHTQIIDTVPDLSRAGLPGPV